MESMRDVVDSLYDASTENRSQLEIIEPVVGTL